MRELARIELEASLLKDDTATSPLPEGLDIRALIEEYSKRVNQRLKVKEDKIKESSMENDNIKAMAEVWE